MQTLNQDIKSGEFKQIYLLYGEEAFLKSSYKNRLKEAIIGDDTMNFARFEGKGLDVDELIRLADTMPFFAERRLILIEDSGFFKTASDALVQYLPSMPDIRLLVVGVFFFHILLCLSWLFSVVKKTVLLRGGKQFIHGCENPGMPITRFFGKPRAFNAK